MSGDRIEGSVHWSGEHWINYLRRPGEIEDSGSFSLYHTRYSAAGEGTVAFVSIPAAGIDAVYADSAGLAEWTIENMIRGRGNQFDREMPVVEACLTRGRGCADTTFVDRRSRWAQDCVYLDGYRSGRHSLGTDALRKGEHANLLAAVLHLRDRAGRGWESG